MDIKLRARLTAYSKVDSINNVNLPNPEVLDAGNILGVGEHGDYTLFPSIDIGKVDTLFTPEESSTIVSKDTIDTLFTSKENPEAVDKAIIDTLFNDGKSDTKVDETDIDTLFETTENVRKVSYSAIDSLFN